MEIRASVRVDLKPLNRFASSIHQGLASGHGPILKAMKQWAERYRSFVQERFDRFSKGGGNWPGLTPSTKRGRRKGKRRKGLHGAAKIAHERKLAGFGGAFSILRDTGTMFGALDAMFANKPGALEERIPFGIRVGFGGPARYPRGGATISDIAEFQQTGAGVLPEREIIVDPDQRTTDAMAGDMLRAVNRLRKENER